MKAVLRTSETLFDPTESRTVNPRKLATDCTHPVVAITQQGLQTVVLSETTGVLGTFDEYVKHLYAMPRTLVVTFGSETLLWKLNEQWQEHPCWTWRVTVVRKGRQLRKRVGYYGFRDPSKKQNRYHLVLDAGSFFRSTDVAPADLLALGQEIRHFCNEHGLAVRPSASGIASQLLRHPSFYPMARRRVPNFINETVREHLPGGHYQSYVDTAQHMEAVSYIDQESAHHYAAMTTPLPNANSVRAQGFTRSPEKIWARKGGRLYQRALDTHGLIRLNVTVPPLSNTHRNDHGEIVRGTRDFVPRIMQHPGERIVHLWTNEIPYLCSKGLELGDIIGTWGTEEVDKGLALYAKWAIEEARKHPHLKALLLMPYGLLGQHTAEVTFHHPHGEDELLLGSRWLEGTKAMTTTIYPRTANALQLGLIQSFVRSLSLDFAQQANDAGHEIVSVYVDGVFVRLTKGKQLPIFAPWRLKEEYTAIELKSSTRVPVRGSIKRDYQHTQ